MYQQTDFDRDFLQQRVSQFRAQVARRISGALSEEEFKPLRLMNGLYLQLHAYMLRVAIPYGTLSAAQMRALADLSQRWDRGYGHFTTRQNIQFNWIALADAPDILEELARVGLHATQTSGNTIPNVTADAFAGAAADEIEYPRPIAELIRQWSTDHPEFQFLPRKFKIAVTGSPADRAVTQVHDIGLRMHRNAGGEVGFEVLIGGGLGRTPLLGQVLTAFLPKVYLLPYLEAVLSTYNQLGRRDNKFKARLKIALHAHGIEKLRDLINAEFERVRPEFTGVDREILSDIEHSFAPPDFAERPLGEYFGALASDDGFRRWVETNLTAHKRDDHAIVTVSLKAHGAVPGDASAAQMRLMADLAQRHSHGELRITHAQNVVLPHVSRADLPALYAALQAEGLASANIGLLSDIIACPGLDYCALATARSIPVAQQIATRFKTLKLEHDIGPLAIQISGCINACGHHHLGHIGILGLERGGVETYQITLGGSGALPTTLGERAGPGFSATEILPAIERLVLGYLELRKDRTETFLDCFRRLGAAPFRALLYPGTPARKGTRNAA